MKPIFRNSGILAIIILFVFVFASEAFARGSRSSSSFRSTSSYSSSKNAFSGSSKSSSYKSNNIDKYKDVGKSSFGNKDYSNVKTNKPSSTPVATLPSKPVAKINVPKIKSKVIDLKNKNTYSQKASYSTQSAQPVHIVNNKYESDSSDMLTGVLVGMAISDNSTASTNSTQAVQASETKVEISKPKFNFINDCPDEWICTLKK